jgi:hypothetical protein
LSTLKTSLRHSPYFRHILAARRSYREGISAAIRRYRRWAYILRTSPVDLRSQDQKAALVELHLFCYWRDYLLALWALKSFYRSSGVQYPLVVHIDGFATSKMLWAFKSHFPGMRIVTHEEAENQVCPFLLERKFDHLLGYRASNVFIRKLVDSQVLSNSARVMVLDSDVLFFARPDELIYAAEEGDGSRFMMDVSSQYTISESFFKRRYGIDLIPSLNAGLGVVHKRDIELGFINECLTDAAITNGDPSFLEQTLYAIALSCSGNVSHLPQPYLLSVRKGLGFEGVVARHYAGDSRPLMTTEGMPHLIDSGLLR